MRMASCCGLELKVGPISGVGFCGLKSELGSNFGDGT